jgi:hypothetical protein
MRIGPNDYGGYIENGLYQRDPAECRPLEVRTDTLDSKIILQFSLLWKDHKNYLIQLTPYPSQLVN